MSPWFLFFCKLVDFVAYTSMLIPFYLARKRRLHLTGGLVTLQWLPIFLFTLYCLMHIVNELFNNNIILIHFNTIFETLIYLKVYHDEFTEVKIKARIKIISIIFLIFAFIDSMWLEGIYKINSYTNLMESAIITILALLFFEKAVALNKKIRIYKVPMFLATTGIVIYLSGTVALYLAMNDFITLNDEYNARVMFLFSSTLLLLLSILLSRAFWLVRPAVVPL